MNSSTSGSSGSSSDLPGPVMKTEVIYCITILSPLSVWDILLLVSGTVNTCVCTIRTDRE